ncbi:50S ribosomal protein L11 methyltransferase [Barrientosiimonas marina]|uniref:Ribosomal protein L11 methyltransferase n=1 Tax=Lentibacillus kimchii TaxID=1542911 RepID=A0ABW2UVY6_9BACI
MNWSEIRIHTTREAVEPISNILYETGINGLVINDPADLNKERRSSFGEIYELNPADYPETGVYVTAYLPVNSDLQQSIKHIESAVQALPAYEVDTGKTQIEVLNEVNEENWANAWKKYYNPVNVSDTMTIVPTWEDYEPADHEIMIELDPGMAFGTGSHATTLLSLQAAECYIHTNDTVIDVGCGSGVLSIAAGLLGAGVVHALDLDDVAVKSTQINRDLNGLQDKIFAEQNDLLDQVDRQADTIIANILAEIIVTFIPDAWKNLKPGGYFITSGIIQDKQQMVEDGLKEAGFHLVGVSAMEDWIAIVAQKPQKESGA